MTPMLVAQEVQKSFDQCKVLKNISLEIQKGEVVALIGRSGSGKSTLLRCLNHLEEVDQGTIIIDGAPMVTSQQGQPQYVNSKELHKLCLKMGFVFQNYNLFPHFTVLRNLTEAQMVVLKRSKKEATEIAMALLKKMDLLDKAHQYPCQLSGGQCQRVAIARALALDPAILCFDEPTSALDPQLTQEVLGVIRDLAKEDRTMIVVTHEMNFAKEVADRIVFMQDGIIMQQGTPKELFEDSPCEELKAFMGILGASPLTLAG